MISCHIWYTGRNTIIEVDHHKNNAIKAILAKLVSNMSQVTNTHHVGHDGRGVARWVSPPRSATRA